MVFKNDIGYNLNSISNNDNYLVLSLNLSRSEQKLFLYDLKSNQQVEISNQAANFSGQNFDKNDVKFVSYSNNIKPEIEKLHKKFNVKKYVRMKSSLKFCVISANEYDGTVLADQCDVVVVTVNSRLGPFGFLDLSKSGADYLGSASNGLRDQILALTWISENIQDLRMFRVI